MGKVKYSEQQARKIAHDLNWDHKPHVTYQAMDESKVSEFYVIGWKSKGRLRTGSVILTRDRAQAEVDRMNHEHPEIDHRIVPAKLDI